MCDRLRRQGLPPIRAGLFIQKTKIFLVRSIHLELLINDHLLQSNTITFLDDGFRIFLSAVTSLYTALYVLHYS